jgi:RNA polymerase sigma factor FliA
MLSIHQNNNHNTESVFVTDPQALLWDRYHQPDADPFVENELIQEYLPLVRKIVGRFARRLPPHVDVEDLYSAGTLGLLNAIRQFDPTVGTVFEGYATFRIRGAVLDELRSTDWAPRSMRATSREVNGVKRELEKEKGRAPSDEETAEALNIPLDQYQQVRDRIRSVTFVSLDAMHRDEDGLEWKETIADPRQNLPSDELQRRQMTDIVMGRDLLSTRQKKVLELRYFEDLQVRDIAAELGVSHSRVSQIHAEALLAIQSAVKPDGSSAGPAGLWWQTPAQTSNFEYRAS